MRTWSVTLFAALVLAFGVASADPAPAARAVDLRDAAALQRLAQDDPAHYATIRSILAELAARPAQAEGDWLQTTYAARDVELSRLVLKTSHPPRQTLRFTLDDTRYTLHVVRSDLTATPAVLR